MNEKQLAKWLMDLAACYDYVPQKAAIARYLRILMRWRAQPRPMGGTCGPRRDPPDQEVPDARRSSRDRIGTHPGSRIARELRAPGQDAHGMGATRRCKFRIISTPKAAMPR